VNVDLEQTGQEMTLANEYGVYYEHGRNMAGLLARIGIGVVLILHG
jgi:hypothetical protein